MKIQPEFNIAAILSKISVADVASNQLSAAQRATSPFESYFEAALQEIDDPQLAATIATLNESGMIQPDSSGAFSAPDAGSGLLMAAGPEALPLSFRTLQLLNGRSVITTSVAFSDTAIRSPAMSEGLLAENPAFKQQSALIRAQIRALLGDTAIVPKESEVAAASVSPAIPASITASRPVPSQKVTAASVMPRGLITVPSVQTPAQEAARLQLFAPTQSVPPQTAVPSQLTASAETAERRSSTEAWLSASVRASSPVPLQTVTAASVMPQGQTTVPSVQTPTQEAARPQLFAPTQAVPSQTAVPAQLTAPAETGERRPSTEAWLSASGRASRPVTLQTVAAGLGSVMPQGQTTVPSVQAPTQEAAQSQLTASAETGERRPSTEAWLSASVRASSPVPLQTVTAASVQPQGQTTVPSVLAPTQSVPSQTAVPAQLAASAETGERLPSTEAWLSSSTRANVEAPALVSTSAPRTSASGMSIIGASQTVSDISTRSRPGARESSAQRFSSSDLPKVAGMAVLADAALAKSDQPALLAMEIPGSASLPAALISESAVQPTSPNQVSVSVPGQPTAQPSADSQRTAERWMHVDDLGKQFGSVIQGALLNRTVAGQTSLRIMLYPENMGGIEAEIIDNNQGVTVNLIAQNDDVVRLLKDHSQALRDLLAQSGSFELNIMKERSGSDAHQARDQSGSGNDRSQPLLESLPKPGNGVVPGSLRPNESGELDTYV